MTDASFGDLPLCHGTRAIIIPHDILTYILEVIPIFIGTFIIFYFYYKKINIPNYLIIVIFIHMLILFIGGYYSYARVPFFDYLKDVFNWSRNNYDKLGHFMQGVTPFLITKELLKRNQDINLDQLMDWDNTRRSIITEIDQLRLKRNTDSEKSAFKLCFGTDKTGGIM